MEFIGNASAEVKASAVGVVKVCTNRKKNKIIIIKFPIVSVFIY